MVDLIERDVMIFRIFDQQRKNKLVEFNYSFQNTVFQFVRQFCEVNEAQPIVT